jgi:hypothetical protein
MYFFGSLLLFGRSSTIIRHPDITNQASTNSKKTGGKRRARNTSMAQLFGDKRYTAAVLGFLATTEVSLRGRSARQEAAGITEEDDKRKHIREEGEEGGQDRDGEGVGTPCDVFRSSLVFLSDSG